MKYLFRIIIVSLDFCHVEYLHDLVEEDVEELDAVWITKAFHFDVCQSHIDNLSSVLKFTSEGGDFVW